MENIIVADLMTQNPVIISPEKNLLEASKIMVRKRIGSLPIVESSKLIGFVSQKDILWALVKKSKKDLSAIRVIDISPKKLAVLKPTNTIKQALNKMKKTKFEKLPVILDKKLVGILTARDILKFKPEIYPEFEELQKIHEETEKLKRLKKAEKRDPFQEGICSECGNQDILYAVNGGLICESCKNSL